MEEIKILRSNEIEAGPLAGLTLNQGWGKRIIYPSNVNTTQVFMGVLEVNPGFSPHRWHTHTTDEYEGCKVVYPKDFVEIYYLVSGSGIVQWKTRDGKIEERAVSAGDTIYFPVGVPEHQLLNNGNEKIFLVACGGPPPQVTFSDK